MLLQKNKGNIKLMRVETKRMLQRKRRFQYEKWKGNLSSRTVGKKHRRSREDACKVTQSINVK